MHLCTALSLGIILVKNQLKTRNFAASLDVDMDPFFIQPEKGSIISIK